MTTTVEVHAWYYDAKPTENDPGSISYADAEGGDDWDGWGVYLRVDTPDDPVQPFDVRHDEDFTTKEEALEYAGNLAAKHDALINIY